MRALALIANLAQLIWVVFELAQSGLPKSSEVYIVSLVTVVPVLTILALWTTRNRHTVIGKEETTIQLARNAIRAKLRRAAENG